MSSTEKKLLSCVLWSDVLCFHRKLEKSGFMDRCFRCPHYTRFMREMDEQEEAFWQEEQKIRKYGYPKRFDVSGGNRNEF